jgi:hypothetical protein
MRKNLKSGRALEAALHALDVQIARYFLKRRGHSIGHPQGITQNP